MIENFDPKKDGRSIVCGTDFSVTAVEAVNIAAAIARRLDTKLVLVHVEQFRGLAVADPSLFEAVISQGREELERETARLKVLGTIVESKLLSGSVFNELINTAVEVNGRLIVVGAVGHSITQRLLLGSVAERVAETSPIPTLVIRPNSVIGAWIKGEASLKLLVGYDFSAASDAALRWVRELQLIGKCEISVMYFDWPPEEAHRLGYHGALPLTETPEEIRNFLERDLGERISMILPPESVSLSVFPGWGRTDAYLDEIARQQKVDLIVVGTHGRHGLRRLPFGSVSRGVLRHAVASVAVVPATEAEGKRRIVARVNRVLVATDFSELGNSAVSHASAILPRGGNLKLIHVIDPMVPAATVAPEDKAKRKRLKPSPKLLGQLRALVPENAETDLEVDVGVVESDSPAEAIAQEAERFDADVICLGSHGRSGVAKTILGSVAQSVMSQTKRPVLVVRQHQ